MGDNESEEIYGYKMNQQSPSNLEDSISESDYLKSVLKVVNGYCKINFVVPQINLFHKSHSMLPINATVNDTALNNTFKNNQISNKPDAIVNMLKNVITSKDNENIDSSDSNNLYSSNKTSASEFQMYSKPSYSENCDLSEKKEDKKKTVSPRGKKKKNKFNKMETTLFTLDIPNSASTNINTDQKVSEYENEKLDVELHEQNIIMKQIKDNANMARIQSPSFSNSNLSVNDVQNDKLSQKSECPLCFKLYPTPDIEAHASECSI